MSKKIIFIPIFFVGMAAFVTWMLMLLWNWLIPALFDLSTISFWQAGGLLILSKILFGGFHTGKRGCNCKHSKHEGWKQKFKHKWTNMSAEDKMRWEEKFSGTAFNKVALAEENSDEVIE